MKRVRGGAGLFKSKEYPKHQSLYEHLDKGQHPDLMVITCADSRVDPKEITQSKPGELFVIRNAGNIIPVYNPNSPGSEAGTIEFGLIALKIKEILIIGHSKCGAMQGLLQPELTKTMPTTQAWIMQAHLPLKQEQREAGLERAVKENILQQMENLETHPCVQKQLDELSIHGWYYDIGSGTVEEYDSELKRFVQLDPTEAQPSIT